MKKKLIIIALFILSIISVLIIKPKVYADTPIQNYNFLFILNSQEDSAVYEGRILYDYNTNHTNNNKLIYINLALPEYTNFNQLLKTNTLYLGYGYVSSTNLILDAPYWCIELNTYLASLNNEYIIGYEEAKNYYINIIQEQQQIHDNELEAMEEYYLEEIDDLHYEYNLEIVDIQENFYNAGYQAGTRNAELGGDTIQYNFYDLVKDVATYPIHFFTEGLDIEIWGINLGALLLGLFMIGLIIIIIKLIIGVIR